MPGGHPTDTGPPSKGDTHGHGLPTVRPIDAGPPSKGDTFGHGMTGENSREQAWNATLPNGTTSWLVIVVWVAATLPLVAWLSYSGTVTAPGLPLVRNPEGLSRDQRLSNAAEVIGHLVGVPDPLSFMIPQNQRPRTDQGFAVVSPFRAADWGSLPGGVRTLTSTGSLNVVGGCLNLVPAPSINDDFLRNVAMAGVNFVESMLEHVPRNDLMLVDPMAWEPTDEDWSKDEVMRYSEVVESILVNKLTVAAEHSSVGAYLLELATRVGAEDVPKLDDVPEELCTRSSFRDRHLWSLPFTQRFTPTHTASVPLPPAQEARPPLRPEEVLLPESWSKIRSWVTTEAKHLHSVFVASDQGLPPPPRPAGHKCEVIGQSGFSPAARGIVWDCRQVPVDGLCHVADFTAPFKSDLNLVNIAKDLHDWPDQEMVGMILNGIQYKADIPLQVVLCPHLQDIALDPRAIQKELNRLSSVENGLMYMEVFSIVPFIPFRFVPQGGVPRKLEAGRPRRKGDGGAPRIVIRDEDGVPAPSLNDAIGLKSHVTDNQREASTEPSHKWPAKEVKPRIEDKMHDDSILGAASQAGFGPLLQLTDDFADHFNQLGIHPSEYWKIVVLWVFLDANGRSTRWPDFEAFIAEYRLGFGLSLSSGIAQRFSEAIVAVFRNRLDEIEEPIMNEVLASQPTSEKAEWIRHRRELSVVTGKKEDRLYAIKIYTDDPAITAVGHERLIRAIEVWKGVVSDYNLRTAIARKRQIGPIVIWLGFHFFSILGKIIVPDAKRKRVQERVIRALSPQGLPAAEYRTMMGLLEHLLIIVLGNRSFMYGMYGTIYMQALRKGGNEIVKITSNALGQFLRNQLERWEVRIKTMIAGCSLAHGTREWYNTNEIVPQATVFGDAAKEGTPTPGLGGYSHGAWWVYPLSELELKLPIVGLEFITVLFNVIIFGGRYENEAIEWLSDAQVVTQVLQNWARKSELTQYIHWRLLESPLKENLGQHSTFRHINGVANDISDAPSRGKYHILEKWSAQVSMKLQQLEVPEAAKRLLQETITFFESMPKEAKDLEHLNPQPPSNGVRFGEASNPGPLRYMRKRERPWAQIPPSVEPAKTFRSVKHLMTQGESAKKVQTNEPTPTLSKKNQQGRPHIQVSHNQKRSQRLPPKGRPEAEREWPTSLLRGEPPEKPGNLWRERARPRIGRKGGGEVRDPLLDKRPRAALEKAESNPAPKTVQSVNSMKPCLSNIPWDSSSAMYQRLSRDESALALKPENPDTLKALCDTYADAMAGSYKTEIKTGEKAGKALRNWITFTSIMGTSHIRHDLAANQGFDPEGHAREVTLCAGFIIWTYLTITPRAKKDPAPRPASALAHLQVVNRWHITMGCPMAKSAHYGKVVTSMCRKFIEMHGPEALLPNRKEPIDPSMIRSILNIPSGTKLGKYTVDWDQPFWTSWAAILCVGIVTGFRKAELVGRFVKGGLSPWNMKWLLKGETQPCARCSIKQLEELKDGDMGVLIPCTSKADPFGLIFGSTPIYLPVDHSDVANAALRIAQVLLKFPCSDDKWESVPLFPMDTSFRYISFKTAEEVLLEVLIEVIGRLEAEKRSMHSLRIGCACALLAAGASSSQIQALVRWRSEESMKIYARLSSTDYAAWVTKIAKQKIHVLSSCNLPTVDAGAHIARALEEADTLDNTSN